MRSLPYHVSDAVCSSDHPLQSLLRKGQYSLRHCIIQPLSRKKPSVSGHALATGAAISLLTACFDVDCAGLSEGVLHSSGHGLGQHGQPASAEMGIPATSPVASAFGELPHREDQMFRGSEIDELNHILELSSEAVTYISPSSPASVSTDRSQHTFEVTPVICPLWF